MAINSIIQSDSITVFGPPEVIEVGLDIGPAGERGSIVYSGSGDPNINTGVFINESPKIKDLYIRTDAGGNYGVLYQYNSIPSGNEWQSVLKFQPSIYSALKNLSFTSGSATVTIPVADFYENAPATLASSNISIQLTPEHSEAIAYSIPTKGIVNSGTRSLVFTVKAKQIAGSTTDLSGTVKFNVFISIVL